jgi:hypothetical protein
VTGVLKWMKDPASVQFRGIEAVQNSHGRIIVCGEVNGRNSAGNVSTSPFVGVLMGPGVDVDFALVGIGSSDHERAEVTSLCRANGLYGIPVGRLASRQTAVSSTSLFELCQRRSPNGPNWRLFSI